jgi:hypothetical protein
MAGVNALKSKLRRVIKGRFPGAKFSIYCPAGASRVGGTLVWDGFVGHDFPKRHRDLHAALAKRLTADERANLGTIFCTTSYEVAVMDESD